MTATAEPTVWGVQPLPEHADLARLLRSVTSLVVSLDASAPVLEDLRSALASAERRLEELAPANPEPRVGARTDDSGRVYLDHGRDIGSWNPMFPVYELTTITPERAEGRVTFPICYEGPAGGVNGGFLAVFFDQVVQHHNCQVGQSGGTRNLDVRFRRPTPLMVPLDLEIDRSVGERSVLSEGRLLLDGELLCRVSTEAALYDSSLSPQVDPRRL